MAETYFDIIRKLAGEVRHESFELACRIAFDRKHKTFVETGCYRGIDADGQSTKILALMARWSIGTFRSCNICPEHVKMAEQLIKGDVPNGTIRLQDSVVFLSNFVNIDFLYLDSYDYDKDNPGPSQRHMLAEAGAAYGKLSDGALILLDDCNIPGGGKALLVDLFLKERGWKLLFDGYQKLYSLQ